MGKRCSLKQPHYADKSLVSPGDSTGNTSNNLVTKAVSYTTSILKNFVNFKSLYSVPYFPYLSCYAFFTPDNQCQNLKGQPIRESRGIISAQLFRLAMNAAKVGDRSKKVFQVTMMAMRSLYGIRSVEKSGLKVFLVFLVFLVTCMTTESHN